MQPIHSESGMQSECYAGVVQNGGCKTMPPNFLEPLVARHSECDPISAGRCGEEVALLTLLPSFRRGRSPYPKFLPHGSHLVPRFAEGDVSAHESVSGHALPARAESDVSCQESTCGQDLLAASEGDVSAHESVSGHALSSELKVTSHAMSPGAAKLC